MKFIVGEKKNMSQVFKEDGRVIPVTIVQAGPCVITQVRTQQKDGYTAVQIGYGKKNKIGKSQAGHLKGLENAAVQKEFRVDEGQATSLERGQTITTAVFAEGDIIKVTGTSKGKGFAGVVKRHGFAGKIATHGTKDQLRMPGSSGPTGPARVFKGVRKPGQMGGDQVTVSNLEVVKIDTELNLIYIKGAVPGARNSVVSIVAQGDMDLSVKETPATLEVEETPEVATEAPAENVEAVEVTQEAPKEATEETKETN